MLKKIGLFFLLILVLLIRAGSKVASVLKLGSKKQKELGLDEIKRGEHLQYAVERSAVESFETLVNRSSRYPIKMYSGRHAVIVYKDSNKVYWGFPKAGFSKTYVKQLYSCDVETYDLLDKQFAILSSYDNRPKSFTLAHAEGIVGKWFSGNQPIPEAKCHEMYGTRVRAEMEGDIYHLIVEGRFVYYNEELKETVKKGKQYTYVQKVVVAEYQCYAHFANGETIKKVDLVTV